MGNIQFIEVRNDFFTPLKESCLLTANLTQASLSSGQGSQHMLYVRFMLNTKSEIQESEGHGL